LAAPPAVFLQRPCPGSKDPVMLLASKAVIHHCWCLPSNEYQQRDCVLGITVPKHKPAGLNHGQIGRRHRTRKQRSAALRAFHLCRTTYGGAAHHWRFLVIDAHRCRTPGAHASRPLAGKQSSVCAVFGAQRSQGAEPLDRRTVSFPAALPNVLPVPPEVPPW